MLRWLALLYSVDRGKDDSFQRAGSCSMRWVLGGTEQTVPLDAPRAQPHDDQFISRGSPHVDDRTIDAQRCEWNPSLKKHRNAHLPSTMKSTRMPPTSTPAIRRVTNIEPNDDAVMSEMKLVTDFAYQPINVSAGNDRAQTPSEWTVPRDSSGPRRIVNAIGLRCSRRGARLGDNNASDNGTMYEYTTVSGGDRYNTDISARSRQRQMYAGGYLNIVSNEQHY
jgi:hypothetical protein